MAGKLRDRIDRLRAGREQVVLEILVRQFTPGAADEIVRLTYPAATRTASSRKARPGVDTVVEAIPRPADATGVNPRRH